jgi:Protein of unknown function (DUF3383)
MTTNIDLTNVITVSILGAPSPLTAPNINTCALFTTQSVPGGWAGAAFKIYTGTTAIATDFGSSNVVTKIATAFFAQQPNPLQTNGYLVVIPRQPAEKTQAAIVRTLSSVYYFGVLVDEDMHSAASDFSALATYVQTLDKVFFYASPNSADYAPGGMLDLIRSGSLTQTRCLYYNDGTAADTQNMAAAYAGRALTTNFAGVRTTQTMHLKTLAGIVPDTTVDQTALTAIATAGVDCYVSIAGVSSLMTSGNNTFWDSIYNRFWIKFAIQTAGFNFLRNTSTKIPQTEVGMEALKNEFRKICEQAVTNGFVGAGTWTSSTVIGSPTDMIRSIGDVGYYVYSQPINSQNSTDRANRLAPAIQIAIKEQGAIHSANVIVEVNL